MKEFLKYCLVGVINTFVGFGVVLLLTYCGLFAEGANFLGYCVGIVCSFFLNQKFTFRIEGKACRQIINAKFVRFLIFMGISYIINLLVLFVSYRLVGLNVYLSQVLAAISYTLSGFVFSKIYVFKG
ncbi:GtrA family protein [Helicobacter burdigaliensis]|uniref:GtrA family protein n=1 Tax=Helicobacter burdigaliensis TaxID=2315334 RepID=UPI000EF74A5C|nr:GtrA family protein [Helicobacter burdigaliensis]